MKAERKSAYTRPNSPCWVKIMNNLSSAHGVVEGEVYPVAQVRWDASKSSCPVRIKSPTTGELVGLLEYEFAYCDEEGRCLS